MNLILKIENIVNIVNKKCLDKLGRECISGFYLSKTKNIINIKFIKPEKTIAYSSYFEFLYSINNKYLLKLEIDYNITKKPKEELTEDKKFNKYKFLDKFKQILHKDSEHGNEIITFGEIKDLITKGNLMDISKKERDFLKSEMSRILSQHFELDSVFKKFNNFVKKNFQEIY